MIFLQFYMEFTSLLFLKTKEKGNELLHLGPWISISSHGRPLAEGTEQGRVSGAVFRRGEAPEVGEKVGEKEEGTEPHLWVSSVRGEEARGGGSTEQGGRRWWSSAAAPVR